MKTRQCFIYERQYFMLETFLNLEHNPSILRVESTTEGSKTKLPPFIKILREVTNDNGYETWCMAANNYAMPESDVLAIQQSLLEERVNDQSQAIMIEKIAQIQNRPGSALRKNSGDPVPLGKAKLSE